jgi:ribonuclease BN (tRNA processing enzyme)
VALRAWLLGGGGWIPNGLRETTCVLLRDGEHALFLDAGTGLRRAITDPELLAGVTRIDIALTHFHLDHTCGLGYTPALPVVPTIWAPGQWLYDTPSAALLAPLRTAPFSPSEAAGEIRELHDAQRIGAFDLAARAQPRHWHPTAGLRVGDRLALITDTAYDPGSAPFARGVDHLLHEAWSLTGDEGDASAAEAAQVAREASARRLTLVHLHPLGDGPALLAQAPGAHLGRDTAEL